MARTRALPSLVALRTFEAAARHSSFRLAAQELAVTESAVSHQIAHLESALGAPLFIRKSGGVQLAEAGVLYYPFLREAFDQIEHGTALIRRDGQAHDLRVQVYVTVAVRWLIPRLNAFRMVHPEIRVRLDASILDWEFEPKSADVGLIYTEKPTREGIDYVHLFNSPLVLVCSPELGPSIRNPSDLANFAALEAFMAPEEWTAWLQATGEPEIGRGTIERFDSYLLAIEAAINGQGVMVVPEFMVSSDIAGGRLVQPLAVKAEPPGGWYLTSLRRRRNDRAVKLFKKWLTEVAAPLPESRL